MDYHLVTGAAGFLGRYLVRALSTRGYRVKALDLQIPEEQSPEVDWLKGDVRDAESLRFAFANVEVVYHLAALIPQRNASAETMRAVNVRGTKNVLEAAIESGVRRVVYLSSVEVFGVPSIVPCPENAPMAPLGEYGRDKIAAERLCREAAQHGVEITILRPPTIVGPGLKEPFLVSLLQSIHDGKRVLILGNGENRYQFVHAQDVAEACILAANHEAASGEDFNIGASDVPPIRKMVEEIIRRAGSSSHVRSIPLQVAKIAMAILRLFGKAPLQPEHLAIALSDYVFDITKARTILGWEPLWGNVDAIWDTYMKDFGAY